MIGSRKSNWFYKNNPPHQKGDAEIELPINVCLARKKVKRRNMSLPDIHTNLTKRLDGSSFNSCSPSGASKQKSSQKSLGTGSSATGLEFLVLNQQNGSADALPDGVTEAWRATDSGASS